MQRNNSQEIFAIFIERLHIVSLFIFYFIHSEYAVCFQGSVHNEQCFRTIRNWTPLVWDPQLFISVPQIGFYALNLNDISHNFIILVICYFNAAPSP